MKKIVIYYSFIVVALMTLTGFLFAESTFQIISATLFYPLFIYFSLLILPKKTKALVLPKEIEATKKVRSKSAKTKVVKIEEGKVDKDRRAFVKLIGTAGTTVFLFSIFGIKKAQAAFFGSVPGPGTVALKDISGNKIDPAEKHPTDGYKISQLDDSSPAFYGFTNKDANWFIMKEDSSGNYRYAKGTTDFPTNWTNRATLSYDYFENIF